MTLQTTVLEMLPPGIMQISLEQAAFAALAIAAALLLQIVAVVIYRLFFHPLSKYPGPFLAKTNDLYMLYYSFKTNIHLQQTALHEQYGPIVRVGSNRLLFAKPNSLKEIYASPKVVKGSSYSSGHIIPGDSNTFNTTDKSIHRVKRKAVAPALSDQSIRKFEPTVTEQADIFVDQLVGPKTSRMAANWSPAQNMADRCSYFTANVMALFSFGTDLKLQTEETNRRQVLGFFCCQKEMGHYFEAPWLKYTNWHRHSTFKGGPTMKEARSWMLDVIQTRISKSRDAANDLFSYFVESKDAESGAAFAMDDLFHESRMFMIAGSDTSASALSAAFFYLSRNRSAYERLGKEIREAFASNADIEMGQALNDCHYLRAVIDESMRMNPPAGKAFWREVGTEGVTIHGEFIQPGTWVGSSILSIFRLEGVYPEANKFIPERWLETGSKYTEYLSQARASFKPFAVGSRNCVGMNLAQAEMTVLLAKAIWNTEFKIPDGPEARIGAGCPDGPPGRRDVNQYQFEQYITPLYDGPWLQFRRRLPEKRNYETRTQ